MNIELNVKDLKFTGTFTPEEPMVMYYKDGSGHPGSPAEFDIEKIEGDCIKLVELLEANNGTMKNPVIDLWGILENLCLENFEPDFEPPDYQEEY